MQPSILKPSLRRLLMGATLGLLLVPGPLAQASGPPSAPGHSIPPPGPEPEPELPAAPPFGPEPEPQVPAGPPAGAQPAAAAAEAPQPLPALASLIDALMPAFHHAYGLATQAAVMAQQAGADPTQAGQQPQHAQSFLHVYWNLRRATAIQFQDAMDQVLAQVEESWLEEGGSAEAFALYRVDALVALRAAHHAAFQHGLAAAADLAGIPAELLLAFQAPIPAGAVVPNCLEVLLDPDHPAAQGDALPIVHPFEL